MTYSLGDVVAMRKILENSNADRKQQWVEQHKLNAMFGYCETTACRRQVLLNYFGEDYRGPCENCDNCLNPVETWDGTVAAQKVLSCIYRTGQRFGAAHVIDVLLGKDTDKVKRFRHDRLSTFGIGEELSATEWRSVIRQLVAADYLSVDVDGYGSIRMTPACGPVLKGEQEVLFRKDPKPEPRKKKKVAAAQTLPETPDDRALFEVLRTTRMALAREQDVPPYVVFNDGTLAAMVQYRPHTLEEFSRLSGVGEVKLDRYGEVFLDVIHQYEAENE
jgi:ATP-dependent DNA helicase RecQ